MLLRPRRLLVKSAGKDGHTTTQSGEVQWKCVFVNKCVHVCAGVSVCVCVCVCEREYVPVSLSSSSASHFQSLALPVSLSLSLTFSLIPSFCLPA